jgi:nucleoside-diphosphate-sugar epimerase
MVLLGAQICPILRFIHWIANNQEVIIYGDGEQKRSFTYIEDIINGLNKLIDIMNLAL